ncbi:hypothetical protein K7X08_026125 [Anisodus acutangulus]|uniref:Cytochrome P450 n=1 Tax=Anisodus acutangulus TaxID=402998 RepID=A0A9Q1N2I0_9SOLA|nr:hypothetical protein K7X08_026125 [Anisodus acutangulus]
MEVLLGDDIFNVDGKLWRKQRKTSSFEFASKNLRDFNTVVFWDYSLKLFKILNEASFKNEQVDMQEHWTQIPENSFAKTFDAANVIVTLRFIDPMWKIKKFLNIGSEAIIDQSIRKIDDFTYSVIRKRKTELETNDKVNKQDILSRFIELGKDPENNMTDKSLRDIVLNFVIAGRDTTATTLSLGYLHDYNSRARSGEAVRGAEVVGTSPG